MPDDTRQNSHALDDLDDDVPEFLRSKSSKKPATQSGASQSGSGKKPETSPKQEAASEAAGKTDTRVYVWMGEEEVAHEEEPEVEHEAEPEFSPGKGAFDLSGNPISNNDSWTPDGARVARDNRDLVRSLDQFDLAGNPIPAKRSASPDVQEEIKPSAEINPYEITFTPPPDEYVWEGDMEIEPEPKPKSKSKGEKEASSGPRPMTAKELREARRAGKLNPWEGVASAGSGQPAAARQAPQGRKGARAQRVKRVAGPRRKASKGMTIGLLFGVLLLGAAGMLYFSKAPHSDIVPVPSFYTQYISPDHSFRANRPGGWDMVPGGAAGYPGSGNIFTQGAVKMVFVGDTAPQGSTLKSLHTGFKAAIAMKYPGYAEQNTVTFTGINGDGMVTQWTSGGDYFHEKMHGYYATMLASGHSVLFVASCPEQNWKVLSSTFNDMINRIEIAQ